jgi:hypothetical protein
MPAECPKWTPVDGVPRGDGAVLVRDDQRTIRVQQRRGIAEADAYRHIDATHGGTAPRILSRSSLGTTTSPLNPLRNRSAVWGSALATASSEDFLDIVDAVFG